MSNCASIVPTQVHAHDLPHSPEFPAVDSHEDHRALPEVLEEEGHSCQIWCKCQYCLAYPEGSNCPKDH